MSVCTPLFTQNLVRVLLCLPSAPFLRSLYIYIYICFSFCGVKGRTRASYKPGSALPLSYIPSFMVFKLTLFNLNAHLHIAKLIVYHTKLSIPLKNMYIGHLL